MKKLPESYRVQDQCRNCKHRELAGGLQWCRKFSEGGITDSTGVSYVQDDHVCDEWERTE